MHFKGFSLLWRILFCALTVPLAIFLVMLSQSPPDPELVPLFWLFCYSQIGISVAAVATMVAYMVKMLYVFEISDAAKRLVPGPNSERSINVLGFPGSMRRIDFHNTIIETKQFASGSRGFGAIRYAITENGIADEVSGRERPMRLADLRTVLGMLRSAESDQALVRQ